MRHRAFGNAGHQPSIWACLLSLLVLVALGSALPAAEKTSPASSSPRVVRMLVTAYCACPKCCGPNAHGVTASGKSVQYNKGRFVAADTNVLPFGTRVVIPGYASETAVEVIDRGGAIVGNHLDVYFSSHQKAIEWGRRVLDVTIK